MELLILDNTTNHTYIPTKLIEKYDSLIWTERYQEPGEFELKSKDVDYIRGNLVQGTLVSLRDTLEVMMVESLYIEKSADGDPEITVAGRTVDLFTDKRVIRGPYQKRFKMAQTYTSAEAASVILWNIFVNTTKINVTRADTSYEKWTTFDPLPNVVITNSTTLTPAKVRRWMLAGSAYPNVMKFLQNDNLGLRVIRPDHTSSSKIVTVSTSTRGAISYSSNSDISAMRFDIYNGVDRTESVVFHYLAGHLLDSKYLWSSKDYNGFAIITSSLGDTDTWLSDAEYSKTGWNREVLFVDAGSPDPNETQQEFIDDMPQAGINALKDHKRTIGFDAEIAPETPYEYGVDYNLGDLVTVKGDYSISQTMLVTEYVRTQDTEGERSYPGLSVLV